MKELPFRTDDDVRAAIPLVREHFARGGLLAYPTETVYGLGSRPAPADVAALAALKGRAAGKPFLLLVSSEGMVEEWGLDFTPAARALAKKFWPGPLTLVLKPSTARLADALRGPEGGIAVRWTSHSRMAHLIAEVGHPITSTSANRPGMPPAPGVGAIQEAFGDQAGLLILNGGALGNVPPSSLVDCTGATPQLIREAAIPRSELRLPARGMAP